MLRDLDKKDRTGQGRARPGGQEIQESAFISGSVSSLWSLSQCPGSEGGGGGVVYRDTGWLQWLGGRLYNLLIDRILQKKPGLNGFPSNSSFIFWDIIHHPTTFCPPALLFGNWSRVLQGPSRSSSISAREKDNF